MTPTPVALFCYNRPKHLKLTVESLLRNIGSDKIEVYFFSDAAKNAKDNLGVNQVRQYIKGVSGFADTHLIEADTNQGLSNSIIKGVKQLLQSYEQIIVLEDDMQCSPFFLNYMFEGLEKYKNEEKVISIHAYTYPIQDLPSTFFLKGADCWGWATWKRGWDLFEENGQVLADKLEAKGLMRRFNFENSYPYFRMLQRQIKGENQSWAIRWYASALLLDKLTLYPGQSLIRNLGNDDSGTHSQKTDLFDPYLASRQPEFPEEVKESELAYKSFAKFFRETRKKAILRKLGLGRFF